MCVFSVCVCVWYAGLCVCVCVCGMRGCVCVREGVGVVCVFVRCAGYVRVRVCVLSVRMFVCGVCVSSVCVVCLCAGCVCVFPLFAGTTQQTWTQAVLVFLNMCRQEMLPSLQVWGVFCGFTTDFFLPRSQYRLYGKAR